MPERAAVKEERCRLKRWDSRLLRRGATVAAALTAMAILLHHWGARAERKLDKEVQGQGGGEARGCITEGVWMVPFTSPCEFTMTITVLLKVHIGGGSFKMSYACCPTIFLTKDEETILWITPLTSPCVLIILLYNSFIFCIFTFPRPTCRMCTLPCNKPHVCCEDSKINIVIYNLTLVPDVFIDSGWATWFCQHHSRNPFGI